MERPQRHEQIVKALLIVLALLSLIGITLTYFKKPTPEIRNYVGKPGASGISVVGPVGNPGNMGVQGLQGGKGDTGPIGPQGETGPQGPVGPQGIQGDQGPAGADGQPGQTPEFRCHNGNYQWRNVGDDNWQTLEKNSQACQATQ